MPQPACLKSGSVLLFAMALLLTVATAGAEELRFSATLGAPDRTASGLSKLTSDQVAVIDALVRRDTGRRGPSSAADGEKEVGGATFSQRLSPEERKTAGLPALSAAELAQLDAQVERLQGARLARTLLAPPAYIARTSRLVPTEKKKEREIHGSFSLSYGMGSGGYSEKAGSMVLTMEDPARGYAISVGYSESHVKGGYGVYRDPFYRDPFTDADRGLPPVELPRP